MTGMSFPLSDSDGVSFEYGHSARSDCFDLCDENVDIGILVERVVRDVHNTRHRDIDEGVAIAMKAP